MHAGRVRLAASRPHWRIDARDARRRLRGSRLCLVLGPNLSIRANRLRGVPQGRARTPHGRPANVGRASVRRGYRVGVPPVTPHRRRRGPATTLLLSPNSPRGLHPANFRRACGRARAQVAASSLGGPCPTSLRREHLFPLIYPWSSGVSKPKRRRQRRQSGRVVAVGRSVGIFYHGLSACRWRCGCVGGKGLRTKPNTMMGVMMMRDDR